MRGDIGIDGKWLEEDFGFVIVDKYITSPQPKIKILEIPGTSDVIDLSEVVTGDVEYKQRQIVIKLESIHGSDTYFEQFSKLSNYLQGRKRRVIFDADSGYYWEGRLEITWADPQIYGASFTLFATVDPYKYETQSSLEPWEWDSFSFEDGIIRDYFDIAVPGSITIIGRRKRACPKIITTNVMTVTYLGNSYNLSLGENIIPDIFLGEGEHVLTFTGTGTVDIDYRGASL